ncbi:MAG: DUF29 domain-containing protein [Pleurocapsa minor HA4230-MV1]|jgi:hypothetical protein|nr:DUF29 domain-containing protein [Pleurocapsa minor HA4230-MV1]
MTDIKELHDRDFNLWVEATKKAIAFQIFPDRQLRQTNYPSPYFQNLVQRSLESYLERLIAHILKLQYWDAERERNYKHWKVEVINFRQRLKRLLKQNPSFNRLLAEIYPEIFQNAVNAWRVEFEIPADTCFIELEQMLKDDFFGFC